MGVGRWDAAGVATRRILPLLASGVAVALGVSRWTGQTRATADERRRPLPGDELAPDPMWQATRATTIHAPREDVWPWLVQMGFPTHRAGWYTPYWMDRLLFGIRAHSARRIVPALQDLEVGDRVLDSDNGISYFTVAQIEPPRALVLHSHTHPLPVYTDVNFVWAFVLDEVQDATRLTVRARIAYTPVGLPAPLIRILVSSGFGVGDVIQLARC